MENNLSTPRKLLLNSIRPGSATHEFPFQEKKKKKKKTNVNLQKLADGSKARATTTILREMILTASGQFFALL